MGREAPVTVGRQMTTDRPEQRILVLFAHPALEKSRLNLRLGEAVRNLPGVTFRDLYELYPDFDVDISREQEVLESHDVIVLQHPFFWYSIPALLKEWLDLVLEHGWAYGSAGTALAGKRAMSAVTTGGREDAYAPGGYNGHTMGEFLVPIRQTFSLCGVDYLPPFVVHGAHGMSQRRILEHAAEYRGVVKGLRDGMVDLDAAREHPRLNWRLDDILGPTEGAG